MMADALLAIRDLTIDYAGHVQAVRGANIDVHLGEAVGLVGESGSGKSTLASAITGLSKRSAGPPDRSTRRCTSVIS